MTNGKHSLTYVPRQPPAPCRHSLVRSVLVGAAVLGAMAALAGCGGHASPPAAKRPAGPPARPRDAEPTGRLSRAEYTSIVREYTLLAPLRRADAAPDVVRRAAAACGTTADPNTRLM